MSWHLIECLQLCKYPCWGCISPNWMPIDQFRYIKIQSQTIHFRTRFSGINPTNSVLIPQSLAMRSIVLGWILIYRNWSIGENGANELVAATSRLYPFSSPEAALLFVSTKNRDYLVRGVARGRDSWWWPKGARPLGTRMGSIARAWLRHAHSFDRCGFQSSVSWYWPEGTWALGTRLAGFFSGVFSFCLLLDADLCSAKFWSEQAILSTFRHIPH